MSKVNEYYCLTHQPVKMNFVAIRLQYWDLHQLTLLCHNCLKRLVLLLLKLLLLVHHCHHVLSPLLFNIFLQLSFLLSYFQLLLSNCRLLQIVFFQILYGVTSSLLQFLFLHLVFACCFFSFLALSLSFSSSPALKDSRIHSFISPPCAFMERKVTLNNRLNGFRG